MYLILFPTFFRLTLCFEIYPCCYRYIYLLLVIAAEYSLIFVCHNSLTLSSNRPLGCFQFSVTPRKKKNTAINSLMHIP